MSHDQDENWDDLSELLLIRLRLGEDVEFANSEFQRSRQRSSEAEVQTDVHVQFWGRTFLRSLFALIEGTSTHMVEVCLTRATLRASLTEEELEELRQHRKLQLGPRLKLTLKSFSKLYRSKFEPNFGDSGWLQLERAIDLRNRITHPYHPDDLLLGQDDLDALDSAYRWFASTYERLKKTIDDW